MATYDTSDKSRPNEKDSDFANDILCNFCENDNKHCEALGYCTDCEDYLCKECYNVHLRTKLTRHHRLLDQYTMKREASKSRDMCTEPCPAHTNEYLKYYCNNHDHLGCGICKEKQHRDCEHVDYIPHIAKDVLKSRDYIDMKINIKSLTEEALTELEAIQRKAENVNTQKAEDLEFFRRLKKDFNTGLDTIEKLLLNDAERIQDENFQGMRLIQNQYKQLLNDIGALESKFTCLEDKGQLCQAFIAIKKAKRQIASFQTSLIQLHDKSTTSTKEYSFKLDDYLHTIIQQPENIASLEIINEPTKPHVETGIAISRPKTQHDNKHAYGNQFAKKYHTLPLVKMNSTERECPVTEHVFDIKVKMQDEDKRPWIRGSTILPGSKLVLLDDRNKKILLVDLKSNLVVSHLVYKNEVFDMTAVSKTRVAISCPKEKKIMFIKVPENSEMLRFQDKIDVKGECLGIAGMGDNLVVSFNNPIKVEIISKKGKLHQTVVKEGSYLSKIFSPELHIAVSPNKQMIFISDFANDSVTRLSISGEDFRTFKDKDLQGPRGLTVDRTGIVYVCGSYSRNIHRLSPDLEKLQVLLKEWDKQSPTWSVAVDDDGKIYVNMYISDIVKVFQLN